jgi:alkylation response protein AidB-like acyl-CoA dehydrogenase
MTETTELEALASTAAQYLAKAWPLDIPRAPETADTDSVRSAWRGAAGLGWPWVAVAESPPHALQAAPGLAALFRAVGQHPAPLPAASLAVALPVLAAAAPGILDDCLDGARLLAIGTEAAWPAGDPWGAARYIDGELTGQLAWVAGAAAADLVVVPARTGTGHGLFLVTLTGPGAEIGALRAYDRLEAPTRVSLDGAAAQPLVSGEAADEALAVIAMLNRVTSAAELAGLADGAVRLAVDYAGQRRQFGRAIGSFQAIKHLLADATIEAYAAESAALTAARHVAERGIAGRHSADLAFSFALTAARRALEIAHQVHGGIGFTLECQLSWYFNRVQTRAVALGSPRAARLELGHAAVAAVAGRS